MATNPFVELSFSPQEVHLPGQQGNYLGEFPDVLTQSLVAARLTVIAHLRAELNDTAVVNPQTLLRSLDEAWTIYGPRFMANLGPLTAAAYYRAFKQAKAGEVPTAYIERLADQHVQRTMGYFRETSAESLIAGFNSFVNQKVPQKAAAERVLVAYGLTNRQITGYVAAAAKLEPKTFSPVAAVKSKVLEYVERSIRQRFKLIAEQEDHNISQEAQQVAWLWMHEHNQLNPNAKKMWVTARDEKVCPSCGPLHGKRVGVREQFKTKLGDFWVPGLHPNCRCIVRLMEVPLELVSKADFEEKEHPRDSSGRFSNKPREYSAVQRFLDTVPVADRPRPELELEIPDVVEEEKPKVIDLTGVVAPGPVDLRRTGRTINLKPINLGLEPVDLTRKQTGVVDLTGRKPVDLRPERKLVDLSQVRTAIELFPEITVPERKLRRVGSEQVYNIGHAVYAVIPFDVMDSNAHSMNMEHNLTFISTESEAGERRLREDIGSELNVRIEDAMDAVGYNNEYRLKTVENNVSMHAEMSPEAWEEIITTVAYSGWNDSGKPRDITTHEVVWYNSDNQRVKIDFLDAYEIADMVGIHEEDFVVPLARLTRSHDGGLGEFNQVSSGTRYGFEEWTFRGPYSITEHPHSGYEDTPNVRTIDLIPEAETTWSEDLSQSDRGD